MRSIEEIKKLRKKYGLTQKELAEKSGVSQSLIAKIEAGTLDPTFTKAKHIFDSLQEVEEKKELKAKDLMHKNVQFCKSSEKVPEVIKIMKRKGISQIPIVLEEKVVGIITENTILHQLSEKPGNIIHLFAGDIMEDVPPIVPPTMGISMIVELLTNSQIVLVSQKGDIKGIITKADLFEKMG